MLILGINVDHVATIRQARGTVYPSPLEASLLAIEGGADQITVHLREDRRHIQDMDIEEMRRELVVPLNLEMAASDEIVTIACKVRPHTATLVPEKRQELTTEGGLNVVENLNSLKETVSKLKGAGIEVSLFIDPEIQAVEACSQIGAGAIELHTGAFCDARDEEEKAAEMERLKVASLYASNTHMRVCAGHGINYNNASFIAESLPCVTEYNIGHAVVARAIFVGMKEAVNEMKVFLSANKW